MTFGTDPDAAVKCPECGAQLVVNLHGRWQAIGLRPAAAFAVWTL